MDLADDFTGVIPCHRDDVAEGLGPLRPVGSSATAGGAGIHGLDELASTRQLGGGVGDRRDDPRAPVDPARVTACVQGFEGDERAMNGRRTIKRKLARPLHSIDTCSVTTTSLLNSILNWLRAGYPEGVPGPDRVPLLALLRSTPLTEDQIKEVVRNITADGSTALADGEIGKDEIAAFIKDVSHHDAGPENVQRIAAKLAAAGWPLAGVDDSAV